MLEYGPGDGQICLNLARLGCRVTAVDLESPQTGTITTVGTVVAEYTQIGSAVFVSLAVTITTNGTGATSLFVTLPFVAAKVGTFVGRNNTTDLLQGYVAVSSGNLVINTYNNGYPVGTGHTIYMSGFYVR